MKHLQPFSLLLIALTVLFSCKKSNESNEKNWNDALKNTVWAGEYNYTIGAYKGSQAYSMQLTSNGTITWTDLASTRPGGTWKAEKDRVTLTFPDKSEFSANVSEQTWSDLTMPANSGFVINNIERSAVIKADSLVNSIWLGLIDGFYFKIKFLQNNMLEFYIASAPAVKEPYTIEGAGIRFSRIPQGINDMYYGVFQNNAVQIKGFNILDYAALPPIRYHTWSLFKQ